MITRVKILKPRRKWFMKVPAGEWEYRIVEVLKVNEEGALVLLGHPHNHKRVPQKVWIPNPF